MMTDQEWGDAALADAEIAVVREELVEIMVTCYLASLLSEDDAAQRAANKAQEFLLSNLNPQQIVRFILSELFSEYSERALRLMSGVRHAG